MDLGYNKKLILEDGSEYYGYGFGSDKEHVTEIVFNTSPVGYQEIVSDPSYTYQTVVMSYPLIGNYGINNDDYETKMPTIGGLVVREYNDRPSNFRSCKTLSKLMEQFDIPGISGIDTRKLSRSIRNGGSMKALITDINTSLEEGLSIIRTTEIPEDAVSKVSRKTIEHYPSETGKFHVVAIDCGMKENILRMLNMYGCDVTVVPWNTGIDKISKIGPDGVFLSNGPGNPEDVAEVIETVRKIRGKYPVFGICLGHQVIALSYGARTYKMKFGHRGGNHPVKNLKNGKIEITSQNHSYAVDRESIKGTGLAATHENILDGTVEGMECIEDKVFCVQYHPESAPGPQDSAYLFDHFIELMESDKDA